MPADTGERAAAFEELRPYLLRVAYSHLGSLAEAEDVVQEAWLRLARARWGEIRDVRTWLTTVVARLALDALTSARARRERYVGPWLPEPLVDGAPAGGDPAERVRLDESVSMALLIVLESLTPAERSAFLLHDVFGYSFAEVAVIVGRTPAATRKLASRARRAVEARRPRHPADAGDQRAVVEAFLEAARDGDVASLLALLDPDVAFRSDGGGAVTAARTVFSGAEKVAGIVVALAAHYAGRFRACPAEVNGCAGLIVEEDGELSVVAFTIDDRRISSINAVRNPAKLRHLARAG